MNDPRKFRQTIQTLVALAMIVSPVALAKPFDWRALVSAIIGGVVAILTNPRLVAVLDNAMPAAGSSAVLPEPKAQDKGIAIVDGILALGIVSAIAAMATVIIFAIGGGQ